MGVHSRQREIDELKEHYIKKTSCIFLVIGALLVGLFLGNAVTMLYMGQRQPAPRQGGPAPKASVAPKADQSEVARLEAAAAADPTNADGWVRLGNYCFDNGLPAKAVMAYEHAVELSPMQEGVWSDLGVMYRRTRQFEKAVDAFEHAAKLAPTHIVSRYNMGVVYLHDLNQPQRAKEIWLEVLKIDPNAKTPQGESLAEMVESMK